MRIDISKETKIFAKLVLIFLLVGIFWLTPPLSAREVLPECEDRDVKLVKSVLNGQPFYAVFPSAGSYHIMISSHKIEEVVDPRRRRPPRTRIRLVPLTQGEFDTLLAQAKSYREEKIALRRQAGWSTWPSFVKTEHFDIGYDIPQLNIYGEGNKDQTEALLIYAERCEVMWRDAEKVFGPMSNSDVNAPLKPMIHDRQDDCVKTAANLVGMKLNQGPVRQTYGFLNIWFNKTTIRDDIDLWETVTHYIGGAIVSQYRGLGRNQGSIPAWLDEGFAFYITRIHRHLDKHTTTLFREAADQMPKQYDGRMWKDVAKRTAQQYDNNTMIRVLDKSMSALTMEERIMAWSIVSFMIEYDLEQFRRLFAQLDTDKDGIITEEEFFADITRFDLDGDLELSDEEKAEGMREFRSFDLNKNGQIDIESECVAHTFRKFVEIQKGGMHSGDAATNAEAVQKSFGWTLNDLFERWRAWLDGRKFETAEMPDLSTTNWRTYTRNLKKALELPDNVKKAQALMSLGRWDTEEAAYILYTTLADIEKRLAREDERPLILYTAAQKVISVWTGAGLDAVLEMALEGRCGRRRADDVIVRVFLVRGVAECPATVEVNQRVAQLCKHPEFALRIAACDILGERGVMKNADKYTGAVLELMNDKVQAVRISAVQALALLANRSNSQQFLRILDALVAAMFNADGIIREHLYKALMAITGEDYGPQYHPYARWVQKYRAALARGDDKPEPDTKKDEQESGRTAEVPTYMGDEIHAKQIVFVIDRSYSMMEPIENLEQLKRVTTRRRPKSEVTGKGKDDPDEPEDDDIDWGKIKVKWDLAVATLLATVNSLKEEHKFTVVLFDHRIYTWSDVMIPANAANKKRIADYLHNQPKADSPGEDHWGRTNIFDALEKALTITVGERFRKDSGDDRPKPANTGDIDIQLVQLGAEQIMLLTDGAPTDGKYQNTNDILTRLRELNRTRKVTINTYGIGEDQGNTLLSEIAKQNNGTYRDLTRSR